MTTPTTAITARDAAYRTYIVARDAATTAYGCDSWDAPTYGRAAQDAYRTYIVARDAAVVAEDAAEDADARLRYVCHPGARDAYDARAATRDAAWGAYRAACAALRAPLAA